LTSSFFETQQVSGFIFANSEKLLKIANRFLLCSSDFSHMGSTKLFPFPSLKLICVLVGQVQTGSL